MILETPVDRLLIKLGTFMKTKKYYIFCTTWVGLRTLHGFALDLRPQYFFTALTKDYSHCLRAEPCFAILSLIANSVFNWGF